jgi:GlcNAc-P-P-Und epimerase
MSRPAERIIVTGGVGFIGTSVCRLLAARGTSFTIVDRVVAGEFRERVLETDIRDLEALRRGIEGDCLIHLAAVHRDDVRPLSLYDEVNVEGTRNLCQVAEEKGIDRIVFASSVAVYGFAPPETGEDGAIAPFNDYGRTKYAAEEVLRAWHAAAPERRSLTIIRPTVVFGPGNRGNVYNLLRQIQSGSFMMVGAGENRKSMAYVDNVAAFFVHALDVAEGVHLYNYIDKPDYTMNELVRTVRRTLKGKDDVGPRLPLAAGLALGRLADGVARLLGRTLAVSHIRVKKFTSTTSFSSAAHAVPGFTAPVSLEQGLLTTLEREFIRPDPEARVFFTE